MTWTQNYDPFGNRLLSTVIAAVPVVVLLASIAFLKIRIHFAALIGLAVALVVAVAVFQMPPAAAAATTIYGAAYGLFPIGWIILNLIFLYRLTVEKGLFVVLRNSLAALAPDPRIQLILVAFSFGAFFEGAAGFGTPVAVTAAILMQLGFKPLAASGLSLIANTAPVAFGALGTPILALSAVTGLDVKALSAMAGRQLPFFSLLVPFWVVWTFAGFRGMLGVWPAALVAGAAFAVPQCLVANLHGPWLVDIVASISSMLAVFGLLKCWRPKEPMRRPDADRAASSSPSSPREERVGRGPRRGETNKNAPPLPDPLLHPMEEREKSRSLMQPCARGGPRKISFLWLAGRVYFSHDQKIEPPQFSEIVRPRARGLGLNARICLRGRTVQTDRGAAAAPQPGGLLVSRLLHPVQPFARARAGPGQADRHVSIRRVLRRTRLRRRGGHQLLFSEGAERGIPDQAAPPCVSARPGHQRDGGGEQFRVAARSETRRRNRRDEKVDRLRQRDGRAARAHLRRFDARRVERGGQKDVHRRHRRMRGVRRRARDFSGAGKSRRDRGRTAGLAGHHSGGPQSVGGGKPGHG